MKDSVYFQNQFLDAVEAMVDHAVNNAGYDKTIKGNIVECTDSAIGKYTIKYQDIYFDAFARSIETQYEKGALVQILVPQNDMRQKKVILDYALDNPLDIDGLPVEIEDYFDNLTGNLSISNETFALNSFKPNEENIIILYDKNGIDRINLQTEGFADGLYEANGFTIGANFQNLSPQILGEFGIVCELNFEDKTQPVVYKFPSYKMEGDPNIFDIFVNQKYTFDLNEADIDKFKEINRIYLYAKDFAITETGHDDDIFIKDFEIYTVQKLTKEQLKSYSVKVNKSAVSFAEGAEATDTIKVDASLYRGKNLINTSSQKYQCYWFKENARIDSTKENYSVFGGNGWELITQTETDTDTQTTELLFNSFSLTTTEQENIAFRNHYKVVITGNNVALGEKQFYIYNYNIANDLVIVSNQGTDFYYNNGNPTLTLLQDGQPISGNIVYYWMEKDANNNNNILEYNGNQITVDISEMPGNSWREYVCTAYQLTGDDEGINLGTASIRLNNYIGEEYLAQYTLNILDKNKTFNYNIYGIAPNNGSVDRPIKLQPLTFELRDAGGRLVDASQYSIQWSKTNDNTLVTIPNGTDLTQPSLIYDLLPKYNPKKIYDNIIDLKVIFNGYEYTDAANFSFVKDGEPGYNGTDIICKIVPNVQNPNNVLEHPTIRNGVLNYNPQNANKWFRAQLWKNGQIIWEGYQSDSEATLNWSILRTSQSSNNNTSNITISNNNFSVASGEINNNANNIVEATVIYNDLYYFGTIPVLVSKTTNNYNINLIKDTGYQYVVYSSAGKNPQWDSSIPFEIEVYNGTTDITNNCTYTWSCNTTNLINNAAAASNENDSIIPIDTFIGDVVKNAIIVEAKQNNTSLGKIYIPIHMYLNKYSLTAINNWDGNSITLDNDEGAILAPQVGAGTKDTQGRFTGVLMGAVKETGLAEPDQGLLGYHEGERTIFLDAKTGKAEFGKTGAGQIILDPTQDKALIYSKNYTAGSRGMLIDLTTPEIKWGNGKFKVDANGIVTATDGVFNGTISADYGNIAGFQIVPQRIQKSGTYDDNGTTVNYTVSVRDPAQHTNPDFLVVYNNKNGTETWPFVVRANGYMSATNAHITGTINAANGTIGGWTINTSTLTGGNTTLNSNGTITTKNLSCSGGSITGSSINIADYFSVSPTQRVIMKGTNDHYWFSLNIASNNPWVSGLNVKGAGGIMFTNGTSYSSLGTEIGGISFADGVESSKALYINTQGNHNLNFKSGNDMGIDSGTQGDTGYEQKQGSYVRINTFVIKAGDTDLYTTSGPIGLNATSSHYCWATGNGVAGKIETSAGTASSRILKQNFEKFIDNDYEQAYNLLKNIELYEYDYKYKMYEDPHQYGFIIDDLEKLQNNKKFFRFYNEIAQIDDNQNFKWVDYDKEELDINNLPKNYISFKRYDEKTLSKFLLTCIKALQYKIDDLERRLK